jgi:hypothetical protein
MPAEPPVDHGRRHAGKVGARGNDHRAIGGEREAILDRGRLTE